MVIKYWFNSPVDHSHILPYGLGAIAPGKHGKKAKPSALRSAGGVGFRARCPFFPSFPLLVLSICKTYLPGELVVKVGPSLTSLPRPTSLLSEVTFPAPTNTHSSCKAGSGLFLSCGPAPGRLPFQPSRVFSFQQESTSPRHGSPVTLSATLLKHFALGGATDCPVKFMHDRLGTRGWTGPRWPCALGTSPLFPESMLPTCEN